MAGPTAVYPDLSPRVFTDAYDSNWTALQFDAAEMERKENSRIQLQILGCSFKRQTSLRLALGSWLVGDLALRLKMRFAFSETTLCIISLYSSNELSCSKSFC
jgi:hypothetical protein